MEKCCKMLILWLLSLELVSETTANNAENITSPCTDSNHIFLAPGVVSPGASSRACLSRFYPYSAARMTLKLSSDDGLSNTAVRDLPPGDGGCLDIMVPQFNSSRAVLLVTVKYHDIPCTWERRVTLRVARSRALVVLPERARYRTGDTLRARIIVLRQDLTPAHVAVEEAWLESPQGARVTSWQRLRTRLGVAQIQHQLDELAPSGRWTLRARLNDGSQGASAIWVGNYELPPFQLSVKHPQKVLRSSDRLVWTVCVRYPWTEAVEGMLVIRIRGAPGGGPGIRTAVRLRAPRACHRHAAAARRVGLDSAASPDVIVADFSFQEEGTRIWQNTTVVSEVVDKAIILEFKTKHRAVIAPGLPYKLKIKATLWDDKPAANEKIKVCRTPAKYPEDMTQDKPTEHNTTECYETVSDATGLARVMFSASDDGSAYYRFQASLLNDPTTTSQPLYLPVQRSGNLHAALGHLKPDPRAARTFVPLYLNMRNINRALTVHFVVITRGGVIYRWGATTQCPINSANAPIETSPRNSSCDLYNINQNRFNYNKYQVASNDNTLGTINTGFGINDNKLGANSNVLGVNDNMANINGSDVRFMPRIMLPIKVTHQMCPDSHLIVYFYYNGEFVSASKYIEMEECFANKVELTWQSRQTPPGSVTSVQISTPGPALCALTALDSTAKWMQPAENVKDVILGGLRRLIDEHRNLTTYDAAEECFFTSDTLEAPITAPELTAFWLAEAGVRTVGGQLRRNPPCSPGPSPLVADDHLVPRSDFSESWLWQLVAVSPNGSATTSAQAPDSITRYEASAVCLARSGLAVSQPAVLQVFREFFIHADGPRRLRRGDSALVQYRIFNYLYEPLSVQIQVLTDPHLEGISDAVETWCMNARSSTTKRVEIRARAVGAARLVVRATAGGGDCGGNSTRMGVGDEVIIEIRVEPEGIPVQEHKSIMLCGKGSQEANASDVAWSWSPVQAVEGTESLMVWAIGDMAGPLLADADELVLLPRGCGEQNMARLATNLLALNHLDPQSPAAIVARDHVARGFTRQLQYMHPQGGFSAFGSSDAMPSTWLTAFSLRYLWKAHKALTPDLPPPPALERAERWLLGQQMENGCFRNEGQVFHRELKGGLTEEGEIANVALTAYVITSLLSTSVFPARLLQNSVHCLRALPASSKSPNKVYAQSLLAYAFARLRRYEDEIKSANEASLRDNSWGLEQDEDIRELVELLRLARRKGDLVWWETGSLSSSIEATGYALLALAGCPPQLRTSCGRDARAAARWLNMHRNAAGGFLATQDTLIALEAITTWTEAIPASQTHLTVTVRGNDTKTFTLADGDAAPAVVMMSGNKVAVHVEGSGCAVVQATRSYNSYDENMSSDKLLVIQATVHTDGVFDCEANDTSCYCAAVVKACVVWVGEFPSMALLELTLPGGFGADAAKLYSQLRIPDTLLRRIELSANSGRATLYLGARDGGATLPRGGHQCYSVHAVGPAAKTKPAYVRVMDYYNPDVNDTQMYTIPEDCPPRISHKTNHYSSSENLYNNGKSLDTGDGIIISEDFSLDDFPDGIPLEDPLYDNLKIPQNLSTQVALTEIKPRNNTKEDTNTKTYTEFVKNSIVNESHAGASNKSARSNNENLEERNAYYLNNTAAINLTSNHRTGHESKEPPNLISRLSPVNKEDLVQIEISGQDIKTKEETRKPVSNETSKTATSNKLQDKKEQKYENNNRDEYKVDGKLTIQESKEDKDPLEIDIVAELIKASETPDLEPGEIDKSNSKEEEQSELKVLVEELMKESQKNQTDSTEDQSTEESKESIEKLDVSKSGAVKSELSNENQNQSVDNPNLAGFHVINSDKDLEVPSGIEGPVPVVVPPPNINPDTYRGYVTPRAYPAEYYVVRPELPWNWRVPPIWSRINEPRNVFYRPRQLYLRKYIRPFVGSYAYL